MPIMSLMQRDEAVTRTRIWLGPGSGTGTLSTILYGELYYSNCQHGILGRVLQHGPACTSNIMAAFISRWGFGSAFLTASMVVLGKWRDG